MNRPMSSWHDSRAFVLTGGTTCEVGGNAANVCVLRRDIGQSHFRSGSDPVPAARQVQCLLPGVQSRDRYFRFGNSRSRRRQAVVRRVFNARSHRNALDSTSEDPICRGFRRLMTAVRGEQTSRCAAWRPRAAVGEHHLDRAVRLLRPHCRHRGRPPIAFAGRGISTLAPS